MATLKELIKQQQEIAEQIERLRVAEKKEAIANVFAIINEYGLTQEDIFGKKIIVGEKATRAKVLAKYRNPETGDDWTGRGRTPVWLKGKNKEDFLIKPALVEPTA